MRLLFAGGGTAGHINPALALANHFSKEYPNVEIQFVGTREGLEAELVPKSGYPLATIQVHGFARSLSLGNIKNMLELPGAVLASRRIIRTFKPDVVIGTGGYVCGPVLYAAAKRKIPTMIHESNAFPGVTTRILAGYVDTVALGVEAAKTHLKDTSHVLLTGNPVRPSLLTTSKEEARKKLGLDARPFLLIFGGSLGAKDFNKTVVDWISSVAKTGAYQILMGTGKNNQYDEVLSRFRQQGIEVKNFPEIQVNEYIYDMDLAMNAADLVISRAGASTLSELTALGKPSILIPSPYVTANHQEHNARALERGGGARVIVEKEFVPKRLEATLKELFSDPKKLQQMGEKSALQGHRDAVAVLTQEIIRLAAESEK